MFQGDLKGVLELLAVMAEAESMVAEFYKACSQIWKEENFFWEGLMSQELHHTKYIKQMADIVSKKYEHFEANGVFNTTAIRSFIKGVRENTEKVRSGEFNMRTALYAAIGIEDSILEKRYADMLKTLDVEYLTLARDIVTQTTLHRGSIDDKIRQIREKDRSSYKRLAKPVAAIKQGELDDVDPIVKITKYHLDISEYKELLKLIPGQIGDTKVWGSLIKLEKFLEDSVFKHFAYEDEIVFSMILSKDIPVELRELISVLQKEHEEMLDLADEICYCLSSTVYPMTQDKKNKLNDYIKNFLQKLSVHAEKEEKDIFPLLKGKA